MREEGQGYKNKSRPWYSAGLGVARGKAGLELKIEISRSELVEKVGGGCRVNAREVT
jgi:hypothetical protein